MPYDIIPPKKSIRQVTLKRDPDDIRQTKGGHDPRFLAREPGGRRWGERRGLWLIAGLSVVLLYFTSGFLFSGARVIVTPRAQSVALDAHFVALKDAAPAELSFQTMTIEKEQTVSLASIGESRVEEKASGTIIVSNTYSTAPQKLIKNTRFETPEGLVYRTKDDIMVPGRRSADGKSAPGILEVPVFADIPGEKYNITLTTFTLPGLKGDPRFSAITAKSKTPMAGGRVGTVKTAAEGAEQAARVKLRAALQEEITKNAAAQVPEGFVLYPDASFTEYASVPNTMTDKGIIVVEKGIFRAIIFNSGSLAKHIATNAISRFDGGDVAIPGIEKLSFALLNKADVRADSARIEFTLRGTPQIVWRFDGERLRDDLAGKTKRMINTVLSGYPGIEKAEVIIRPFWKNSFPDKSSKISVETVIPEPPAKK